MPPPPPPRCAGHAHTFFVGANDKPRAGELINVLREAKQKVPEELLKFGTTGEYCMVLQPVMRPSEWRGVEEGACSPGGCVSAPAAPGPPPPVRERALPSAGCRHSLVHTPALPAVKKKESKLYGAHFKDVDHTQKATKVTFDSDSD